MNTFETPEYDALAEMANTLVEQVVQFEQDARGAVVAALEHATPGVEKVWVYFDGSVVWKAKGEEHEAAVDARENEEYLREALEEAEFSGALEYLMLAMRARVLAGVPWPEGQQLAGGPTPSLSWEVTVSDD